MSRIAFTMMDETFMHLDEPTQPISVHAEVRVSVRLDEERLRQAVHAAAGKHPRARAHLRPWDSDAESYEWQVDDDLQVERLRVVSVDAGTSLDGIRGKLYSQPLTLLESPPFRVLLVHDPAGDVVLLAVHHSASDGMGALRLLQSIVRAYADVADDTVPLEIVQQQRRAAAGEHTGGKPLGAAEGHQAVAAYAPPTKLTPRGATTQPGYGIHTLSVPLAPIVAAPLRRRLRATVNDLLLAAVHLAVDTWQRESGDPAGTIAVAMPMNRRPEAWRYDVVGNHFTTETVDTDADQRRTPESCLAAVVAVTSAMKGQGGAPSMAGKVGRAPQLLTDRRDKIKVIRQFSQQLSGTLTLSNVGRVEPDWIGQTDLDVRELWFTPPPVGPSVGIGAASVGPTLHLAFRYTPSVLSHDAAVAFAGAVRAELDHISTST